MHLTPVLTSERLDAQLGARIYFKCEHLQKTGSFKCRGALWALRSLAGTASSAGVVSVSAGNHAQAVAWAAAQCDLPCVVAMPRSASRSKIDATREYGGSVIFAENGAAAFRAAQEHADATGAIFLHPFDDPFIVSGAGSVGLEMVEQTPHLDVLLVPVGGGGLISGVALAMRTLSPGTRIYGVEPRGANAMALSLEAGKAITLPNPPATVADGLAAPMAGELNFRIVRDTVDDILLVDDSAILEAMRLFLTRTKQLAEPAGAAAFAALLAGLVPDAAGKSVGVVISGGNVDLNMLAS